MSRNLHDCLATRLPVGSEASLHPVPDRRVELVEVGPPSDPQMTASPRACLHITRFERIQNRGSVPRRDNMHRGHRQPPPRLGTTRDISVPRRRARGAGIHQPEGLQYSGRLPFSVQRPTRRGGRRPWRIRHSPRDAAPTLIIRGLSKVASETAADRGFGTRVAKSPRPPSARVIKNSLGAVDRARTPNLCLVGEGLSNTEVGRQLHLSDRTVKVQPHCQGTSASDLSETRNPQSYGTRTVDQARGRVKSVMRWQKASTRPREC